MDKYRIQDNLVVTKDRILSIFQLEPVDLVILPEAEQEQFELNMRRMLNSLQEQGIQIIMRTRNAVPQDLEKHFGSFTPPVQSIKYKLFNDYVEQLKGLLANNNIPVKEYFVAFSQTVNTNSQGAVTKAQLLLNSKIDKTASNFQQAGITIKQLDEEHLIKLFNEFTRP